MTSCSGTAYAAVPHGTSTNAVQLVNLATVNYVLWGLQVGQHMQGGARWRLFFNNLCPLKISAVQDSLTEVGPSAPKSACTEGQLRGD